MTPPQKRNKKNAGLPTGWRYKNGWYWYRTTAKNRHLFDDRGEFPLGKTLPAAHKVFGERLTGMFESNTMPKLLSRYEAEVTPHKAQETRRKERKRLVKLREILAGMTPGGVKAHHCYKIRDALAKAHGKRTANLYMATLSHVLTKAVEWGEIDEHPMIRGKFKKLHVDTQRHIPEHWEIDEALTVAPALIRVYVGLKRITGLRQTDLLALRRDQWQEDGLHVTPSKTRQSSGKTLIFERTPDLEAAVQACLDLHKHEPGKPPRVAGQHLFCTREGQPYTASGFDSAWQRWMKKALVDTKLEQRFNERSLRTYVGSWSESDQDAANRLGHSSTSTTRKHYRERPAVVKPLKVEK